MIGGCLSKLRGMDQLAQARMEGVKKAGKNIKLRLGWRSGARRAAVIPRAGAHVPHRVRNTQNKANDIHSVWSDFNFGQDLLKAHYQTSHGWNAARSGKLYDSRYCIPAGERLII